MSLNASIADSAGGLETALDSIQNWGSLSHDGSVCCAVVAGTGIASR